MPFKLAMLIVFSLISISCNKSTFSGTGEKKPLKTHDFQRQEFALSSVKGRLIDMVWLIDNSGSMNDEIELVRNNFSAFIQNVSGMSDLQLGLISTTEEESARYGITLSKFTSLNNAQQFAANVGSTNGLAMLAAAMCSVDQTSTVDDVGGFAPNNAVSKICGQAVESEATSSLFTGLENAREISGIRGKLASFFRPQSKKVIIVVTDDNARGVNDKNFLSMIKNSQVSQSDVYFYGFISKSGRNGAIPPGALSLPNPNPNPIPGGRTGCHGSRIGESYVALAKQTNGDTFEICDANWQDNFSKLTDNLKKIIKSDFNLKVDGKPFRLDQVLVDGRVLEPNQYSLNESKLTLNDPQNFINAQKLEVRYEVLD